MARQALNLLCSTLPAVADELGVSLDSLRSYRALRRSPSPATTRALAALLRRRSRALVKMADRLDRAVKGGDDA